MSKAIIESVFSEITNTDVWSLQLLKINNSKKKGTSYFTREITLSPREKLQELIAELSTNYLTEKNDSFDTVDEYTGNVVGNVIYRMPVTSEFGFRYRVPTWSNNGQLRNIVL